MQSFGADERVGSAYRGAVRDYRRLQVWPKAHGLALGVRRATRAFPRTGYSSFKAQIVSAAESIAFNIVEGCGAASQKEFARFLEIAIKSACELEYQLELAHDYQILPAKDWKSLTADCVEVRRMLCGLRRKIASDLRRSGRRATRERSPRASSTADGYTAESSQLASRPPDREPDNPC